MNVPALIRTFLAVLVGLAARPAGAIAPDKSPARLSSDSWQVKDGLPGDSVQALAQATDGRLWVATLGGLVRYDGWKFGKVPVPEALAREASDVTMIVAARDGSVWLGSLHHAPMRFGAGALRGFGPSDGWPQGASVRALAEDAEGHVWVASSRGLFEYVPAHERFIPHALRGGDSVHVTAMAIDDERRPWLGTRSGIYTLREGRIERAPAGALGGAITALHFAGRTLWAAGDGALVAFEGCKPTTTIGTAEGLPAAAITSMAHDTDGNLWLATAAGLVRVRQGRAQLYGNADGLPAGEVTAVLVDRERSLWLGTRLAGLVQLTDRTLDTHAGPAELAGRETLALCEDAAGAMWFGTRGSGAVRWQGGQASWFDERDGLPASTVNALLPADGGAVWLGTQEGLVRWRPGEARGGRGRGRIDDPGIWPRRVRTLFRDSADALWIGGDGVLGRYAGGKLTVFSPKDGMIPGHIRTVAEDSAGVLWVSGVGGLVRRSGDRFVKTTGMESRPAGQVRAMLLGSDGAFWMTTGRGGLVRRHGGQEVAFDARVGLESEMLYGLLEDDAGNVWIGTNKSILRITRPSLHAVAEGRHPSLQVASFETTDRRTGVIATQLHQPSAWKARDGHLWFLTQQGPVRIDPRRVATNTAVPRLSIDAVLADGQPVAAGGRARLPRPPSKLEFHYDAVTLLQPRKVRYRRWLEGHDAGWVEAGSERVAVYQGLREGSYRFRVQASNNDGVWTGRGPTFSFAVEPPFYRRLWFYVACALALVPIAWFVHRSHLARVRARYVGMLTERTRMARDLHDTLLQGMSNVALQLHGLERHFSDAPPGPRGQFDLIRQTVSECLDETRRVVRGLREGDRATTSGALGPALERLARRLQTSTSTSVASPPRQAGAAQSSAEPARCEVLLEGPSRPLSHAVEDELYRIGQEALTNALRHAGARRIELRLSYEPARVRLVVSDDGRGFDPAAPAPEGGLHFGLAGLRERAGRIGASLEITSQPGQGTRIEVIVNHPVSSHAPADATGAPTNANATRRAS